MSNAVPSAVHAIPRVTRKTRIANWSFESSAMMVKSIAEEWRFLMMRDPRLLKSTRLQVWHRATGAEVAEMDSGA